MAGNSAANGSAGMSSSCTALVSGAENTRACSSTMGADSPAGRTNDNGGTVSAFSAAPWNFRRGDTWTRRALAACSEQRCGLDRAACLCARARACARARVCRACARARACVGPQAGWGRLTVCTGAKVHRQTNGEGAPPAHGHGEEGGAVVTLQRNRWPVGFRWAVEVARGGDQLLVREPAAPAASLQPGLTAGFSGCARAGQLATLSSHGKAAA